jgi:hypothetical protein
LGKEKSAQSPTGFSVKLQGRDLEDARRILTGIVSAGKRRSILTDGRAREIPKSDGEDPAERLALQMFAIREARDKFLPHSVSGAAAWDILLAVYLADRVGVRHNIGRTMEISRVKLTTGLRYIDLLEAEGLLNREQDSWDARIFYLILTPRGGKLVAAILSAALSDQAETSCRRPWK